MVHVLNLPRFICFFARTSTESYFHHDFNNDICHHFGRWNVDIDVETVQENAQALEDIEEIIII